MVDWHSQAEIIKDGGSFDPLNSGAPALIRFLAAFGKFMHALLGLYMYVL